MAAILFFELGKNYYQASFSGYIAFVQNLMKLAGILQDLEHLCDFKQLAIASILFFKMRPKFCTDRLS